ncbi:MAG: helix-turn-helix transcriptional regulator [Desulfofustis sp.]|nr:helix-turn-helix transcriptional regulator [Desulfofustis sp.]
MNGQQLRQARLELGLTQQQLAETIAVTQSHVSDMESGRRAVTRPRRAAVLRLLDEHRRPVAADICAALEPLVGPERAALVSRAIVEGGIPHITIDRRDHATT